MLSFAMIILLNLSNGKTVTSMFFGIKRYFNNLSYNPNECNSCDATFQENFLDIVYGKQPYNKKGEV
jgi:hypothetical protein